MNHALTSNYLLHDCFVNIFNYSLDFSCFFFHVFSIHAKWLLTIASGICTNRSDKNQTFLQMSKNVRNVQNVHLHDNLAKTREDQWLSPLHLSSGQPFSNFVSPQNYAVKIKMSMDNRDMSNGLANVRQHQFSPF